MTKIIILSTLIACFSTSVVGQTKDLLKKIDSLQYLNEQPFDCASVYWRVVASGKDAIPFLIDKLDDTTATKISLTCKRTNVKFGDICYKALTDIFSIPYFYVTRQQFDFIDQLGCQQGLFTYLNDNRTIFKSQILNYYNRFKSEIEFKHYNKGYNDKCKRLNRIYGYYAVDRKWLKD